MHGLFRYLMTVIAVTIESNDIQTAFDVAKEKCGLDHPVTQVFLESGLYDNY